MNFWVPIIKDIVLAGSAIVTVCLAIYGLKSWRRELTGKTHFEAAKRLLQALYKVREAFWGVRSRFIAAAEFPPGYGGAHGKSHQEEFEAFLHVFKNRWEPLWEGIQEFDIAALEGEVLFGEEIKKKTDNVRSCLSTLRTSIDFELSNIRSGRRELDRDFEQNIRRDIYASREDDDPLSIEMRSAISEVERVIKPHFGH